MSSGAYGRDEANGLWVYLEERQGRLEGVSLELLGKGRELADLLGVPLTALLVGYALGDLPNEAVAAGADVVLVADHPALQAYTTEPFTRVVASVVNERRPEALLLGATPNGRDLAGRLAVRLRTGLTADCTGLSVDPERRLLLGEVVGFGGGIVATIVCPERRPQMATVRPGIFPRPERRRGRRGEIVPVPVRLDPRDTRVRVLERSVGEEVDLTRATAIVAVGRGMRGELALAERLASLLGAEIGGTRVAADLGWIERSRQIGQTGVVTRPRLAVCCGVSGAIHFMVGVEAADCIVAINTDPDAAIFEQADYAVVEDAFAVLPHLIEALSETKVRATP
ncbi:MAG TPA: electron transfer flavoprotein subunit alpha/FixB family protein [Dehalococcoidia bacterium]|nr:electron transfer flavoprotein subunit alpha/FixB family protein [Dehalococcoidia bacterium]